MKFIEIKGISGLQEAIKVNGILSIADRGESCIIYHTAQDTTTTAKHTYEELKQKLKDVGCEIR